MEHQKPDLESDRELATKAKSIRAKRFRGKVLRAQSYSVKSEPVSFTVERGPDSAIRLPSED